MATFLETISIERLPVGRSMVVRIASKDVALFNVDGNIHALSDACAHAGASLGSSKLRGRIVTCRGHGFQYDVTTGACTNISGLRAASYPVKVVDDKIMVSIDS
jgi:3-phenylpropionate/trans-cinnamate dioxygenase ferredoxin subunit